MHETEEQTTAIIRLVDKAKTPAQEFLDAVGTLLKAREYKLNAYGVESASWQGERESATVQLGEKTTLTIQLVKS